MEFKEKALVEKIEEEQEEERHQRQLKDKHGIEDENVVVVEKFSLTKFITKTFISFVKTLATIMLLVLAAVGIIALIYDEVRNPLIDILKDGLYMFERGDLAR